ncbi:DUF58 domain-containing protein [Dactylosporangium sp. NPDC000521]|uniref:DUF58 domain-containing protein n=1 Tax=Dactylosporangium sp. NPDC000521 TaxID=3363975 RepID=UPI0036C602D0
MRLPPVADRLAGAVRAATPLGRLVLAGSVLALAAGAYADWIEAVTAGLTGLFTLGIAALFTVGRTAITVDVAPQRRRVVTGEHAPVTVTVTNVAPRRMLPFTLEVGAGAGLEVFAVPGLAAGATHANAFEIQARRRGVIPVGPATSVRGDPLRLLQRRVEWAGRQEVFVHPATVRLDPVGQGLLRDLEGRTTNDVSMSDLAFHTLREYVPGDDRRYIHWRSSAKADTFLVRQFQDTRRTCLLVVVDDTADAYGDPDEFETAVSAAASVAVRSVDDAVDVTLLAGPHWTGSDLASRRNRQKVLDTCARADLGAGGLPQQVARGVRAVPEATYAVVVTGSRPTFADLRRACAQLPAGMPAVAVRVDPGARPRLAAHAALTVVTLPDLADLPGLLR